MVLCEIDLGVSDLFVCEWTGHTRRKQPSAPTFLANDGLGCFQQCGGKQT